MAMSSTTNPNLSPKARAILQKLNCGAVLTHLKEDDSWKLDNHDITRDHRACEEINYLCAIETLTKSGWQTRYRISNEGRRLLALPQYRPIITRKRT